MPIFADNRPLLEAFRRGEAWALDDVYRHYFRAVSAVVCWGFTATTGSSVRGIKDVAGQHDLIHDVFVRAFKESARLAYDGVRPYKPYLLRIARNLLIDRARKQGHEVLLADDEGAHDTWTVGTGEAVDDAPGEEDLDWRRLASAAEEFVAGADPEIAAVVKHRFCDGLPQQEVAKTMSTTRDRVRTLERKAVAQLRKHLKRLGLDEVLTRR